MSTPSQRGTTLAMSVVTMTDHAASRNHRTDSAGRAWPSGPGVQRKLVLIVDDDPIVLEVTKDRLEQLGAEVRTRSESLGTSRWILENKPDFVLLDLMMPALTGSELARVLKRREVKTGIIVYSSLPQAHLDQVARDVSALGALSKALDDTEFERQFLRLVTLHSASAEVSA
jgi:two-component system alkaline phosphatase synthesis response regulator PhoP